MPLMTGVSVTLAHSPQAATTPSPSMIPRAPFLVPALRADGPTSSSTPCLPTPASCVLQRLITISSCPRAKPQRLLHACLCLAPLPTLREWEAHAPGARQGCSWPACLTQLWGVEVLQGSWCSTSSPNPIPYLGRGTAGGCGASFWENWSVSAGDGGARAGTGMPKAPLYPGHCARPILQLHSLPPTWLEAEPSTNWSFVSCWPCRRVISV